MYRCLGHPSFFVLKSVFPSLFTKEFVKSFKCHVCQFAKHHRVTYPSNYTKSVHPFDLVHFNVWELVSRSSIYGVKWFVTFIVDCTRITWIFLMIKTQFGKSIKCLRSDNGREYVNHDMSTFLFENGVVHEFICGGHTITKWRC